MMKRKNTIEERNAAPAATRTTTSRGRRAPKGVLRRLLKTLFEFYPVLLPVTLVCILINALVSSMPAVFLQKVMACEGLLTPEESIELAAETWGSEKFENYE